MISHGKTGERSHPAPRASRPHRHALHRFLVSPWFPRRRPRAEGVFPSPGAHALQGNRAQIRPVHRAGDRPGRRHHQRLHGKRDHLRLYHHPARAPAPCLRHPHRHDRRLAPRPEEMEKEKEVIINEIRSVDDSPEEKGHDRYLREMWGEHSLARKITGEVEEVQGIEPRRPGALLPRDGWFLPTPSSPLRATSTRKRRGPWPPRSSPRPGGQPRPARGRRRAGAARRPSWPTGSTRSRSTPAPAIPSTTRSPTTTPRLSSAPRSANP